MINEKAKHMTSLFFLTGLGNWIPKKMYQSYWVFFFILFFFTLGGLKGSPLDYRAVVSCSWDTDLWCGTLKVSWSCLLSN